VDLDIFRALCIITPKPNSSIEVDIVQKENPKRWYLVMIFCMLLSFIVFVVAPRMGYPPDVAHDIAIMIGVWAPVMGIMGIRAEAKLSGNQ
jgi:hypothetical protein